MPQARAHPSRLFANGTCGTGRLSSGISWTRVFGVLAILGLAFGVWGFYTYQKLPYCDTGVLPQQPWWPGTLAVSFTPVRSPPR